MWAHSCCRPLSSDWTLREPPGKPSARDPGPLTGMPGSHAVQFPQEDGQPLTLRVRVHRCPALPPALSPVTSQRSFLFTSTCVNSSGGHWDPCWALKVEKHHQVCLPPAHSLLCSLPWTRPLVDWTPASRPCPAVSGPEQVQLLVPGPGLLGVLDGSLHLAFASVHRPFKNISYLNLVRVLPVSCLAPD